MKNAKAFSVGDKVFAKVKGYPAWPAKVVAEKSKKYEVTFYGTLETGTIKGEDLFYYLKHKKQFSRNIKRKDFIEAIEQIEVDIKETGTDGSQQAGSDTPVVGGNTAKRGRKRKGEAVSEATPSKKRNKSESEEIDDPEEEDEEMEEGSPVRDASAKPSPKSVTRSGRVVKTRKILDADDSDENIKKKGTKAKKSDVMLESDEEEEEEEEEEEIEAIEDSSEEEKMYQKKNIKKKNKKQMEDSESEDEEAMYKKKAIKKKNQKGKKDSESEDEEEMYKKKTTKKKNLKGIQKGMQDSESEDEEEMYKKKATKRKNQKGMKDSESEEEEDNEEEDSSAMGEEDSDEEIEEEEEEEDEDEFAGVNIISLEYLEIVIAYAAHVKSKAELYKKRPIEPRQVEKNEAVMATLPSKKLIGIVINFNALECNNEYEKAIFEGQEAERILAIKEKIENGTLTPENEDDSYIFDLDPDDDETEHMDKQRSVEREKTKLKYLQAEASLVDYDCKIKGFLGLDKADPKKALEYIDLLLGLDINKLMLKKHPFIVDVMKRLRRYVGNVKKWELSGESLETFESDAEKIRKKADKVFMKFVSLFRTNDHGKFWDVLNSDVKKFSEDTKDMSESEIFALAAEPHSRQAFFDAFNDKKDGEKVNDGKGENHKEKENSSDVANTEKANEAQNIIEIL